MSTQPLIYVEFAPGAAVRDLALTYCGLTVGDLPRGEHQLPLRPDGCLVIALALRNGEPHATPLVGPRRETYFLPVQSHMQYWSVRFRPEMGASFLGRPARMLRDQGGPAHHWMGAEPLRMLAQRVTSALRDFPPLSVGPDVQAAVGLALDRWLFDSADTTMPPDQAVRDAIRAIVATEGSHQMAAIASLVGVSPRHLQRCFKEAVGLTLKEYALLRRDRHAARRSALGIRPTGAPVAAPSTVLVASEQADALFLARDVERLLFGTPEALRRRLAAI